MNNNDNNELNSYSLGGIQENNNIGLNNIDPVAPISEASEAEILNMGNNNDIPNSPVSPMNNNDQFNMGMNNLNQDNNLNQNSFSQPNNFEQANNFDQINNFSQPNFNQPNSFDIPPNYNNINPLNNNDIGVVPNNSVNKKKKPNKLIFIIIIVLSLAAVGVGVYMLLHVTNSDKPITNTASVNLKNAQIEIGDDIPTDLTFYADFNNIDPATCSIDTTNIKDTETLNAKYKFTISCMNNKNYEGEVTIVDTKKPEVKTKEVKTNLGGKVLALDFIETCDDMTTCSYAFKDENTVSNNLQKAGTYDVVIIVQDEAKNSIEVTAKLTVSDIVAADVYLNCSANNKETIKLGIASSKFTKQAMKVYTYTLDEQAYQELKNNSKDLNAVSYTDSNGKTITGVGVFDDGSHTLTLTVDITYENLVSEYGDVPENVGDLKNYFTNKNYTCSIGGR